MTTTLQDYFPVVIEIIMIVMLIANLLFIIYFNDVVTDYAERVKKKYYCIHIQLLINFSLTAMVTDYAEHGVLGQGMCGMNVRSLLM